MQVRAQRRGRRLRLRELVEQVVDQRRPGAELAQGEVRLRVARDVAGRHPGDRVAELHARDERRRAGEEGRAAVVERDGLRHVRVEAPGAHQPTRGLRVVDTEALALQTGEVAADGAGRGELLHDGRVEGHGQDQLPEVVHQAREVGEVRRDAGPLGHAPRVAGDVDRVQTERAARGGRSRRRVEEAVRRGVVEQAVQLVAADREDGLARRPRGDPQRALGRVGGGEDVDGEALVELDHLGDGTRRGLGVLDQRERLAHGPVERRKRAERRDGAIQRVGAAGVRNRGRRRGRRQGGILQVAVGACRDPIGASRQSCVIGFAPSRRRILYVGRASPDPDSEFGWPVPRSAI